jgi:hypothetical protein
LDFVPPDFDFVPPTLILFRLVLISFQRILNSFRSEVGKGRGVDPLRRCGVAKWPMGSAQPFERARFAEGKTLDFASTGLDFPSLRLGFSFPRAWIFLPQEKPISAKKSRLVDAKHAIAQLPSAARWHLWGEREE